ncbi:CopG family transcriptional regulator [Natronorubrum sp. JWXQ-INN-674]|uniref:CopG family transcriptional regulator n=1 Tax=Natronorubrum halalkaliphilum TaxID=2691917 RepID=A0A6B0VNN3_9EURY|nr:zinc ribbon domain-containing protein [Natronorubrum halalkaliphilum]MXV63114.1 CopG family transcriptional regulator [Natronorubrum halalkaliphilum]
MSKITFRADDDLVEQLEALEISKSEAMRQALRSYLAADGPARDERQAERERSEPAQSGAIDELIRDRVDELLSERLQEYGFGPTAGRVSPRARDGHRSDRVGRAGDVNISISLEDDRHELDRSTRVAEPTQQAESSSAHAHEHEGHESPAPDRNRGMNQQSVDDEETAHCNQCGEQVDGDHVYCPNCGEKTSRRLFCDCGDEIRSDWAFCPGCGRRTPAADVLGRDSPS